MSISNPLDVIDQSVLLAELGELIALSGHIKKQTVTYISQGKPLSDDLVKAIAVITDIENDFAETLTRSKSRRADAEQQDAVETESIEQRDQEAGFQKQLAELQSRLDEKDRELKAKDEKLEALQTESIEQRDQSSALQKQVADLQLQVDRKDRELKAKDEELSAASEMMKRLDSPVVDSEQLSEHEEASYQVISGLLITLLLAKKGVKDKAAFPSEAEVIREIEQLDLYGYKKGTLAKRFKDAREKLENELKKKPPTQYRSTA